MNKLQTIKKHKLGETIYKGNRIWLFKCSLCGITIKIESVLSELAKKLTEYNFEFEYEKKNDESKWVDPLKEVGEAFKNCVAK